MSDPTLSCPECGTDIKLTESLAGPLIASLKDEHSRTLKLKDQAIAEQQKKLSEERDEIAAKQASIDDLVAQGVAERASQIASEESEKAKKLAALDLAQKDKENTELKKVLEDREQKLAKASDQQADLIKQQRALEDEKRALDLTVQTKISEELKIEREKLKREQETAHTLELREFKEREESYKKQLEDMKRKLEQGSQQTQGEVLELELEDMLKKRFIHDKIDPVGKGIRGGDIIQTVMSPNGSFCGKILWETKRAKNWSGSWIPKLKEDQRAAEADIAIIMSHVTPQEVDDFDEIDGVWVTGYPSAGSLVTALRRQLIEVSHTKIVREGQATKAELIYDYLTGPGFKQRVQAALDKTSELQDDLNKEKRLLTRNWAKRQKQIDGVVESMTGMHGDLQGIAGKSMLEIEEFEVPLLDEGTQEAESTSTE